MNKILTTHAGSLIRPPAIIDYLGAIESGADYDRDAYATTLRDVGRGHRRAAGRDRPRRHRRRRDGQGDLDHLPLRARQRPRDPRPSRSRAACCRRAATARPSRAPTPRSTRSTRRATRESRGGRDGGRRRRAWRWPGSAPARSSTTAPRSTATSPTSRPRSRSTPGVEGFLPVVAPASAYWLENEYYGSEEEFVFALADALHEEYKAIADSGLLLQVDDAVLMHECDSMLSLGKSYEDYRRWAELRVARAQPRAARASPRTASATTSATAAGTARTRSTRRCATSSTCCSTSTPATTRSSMANPRHEHEWRIWEDVKLPEGKKLIPGVVTHHTNVVEHPELVAQRLVRLAKVVGARERDRRHRLRLRPGRADPARPRGDPVGQAQRARRGRADRVEGAVGREGRRLRRRRCAARGGAAAAPGSPRVRRCQSSLEARAARRRRGRRGRRYQSSLEASAAPSLSAAILSQATSGRRARSG